MPPCLLVVVLPLLLPLLLQLVELPQPRVRLNFSYLINNFNHFVNYTAEEKKKEEKKEESEEEDDDMGFGLFD